MSDLVDFSWDDSRHIHPVWPDRNGLHPTIIIPSSQKNGRMQEIPMLPGLADDLEDVPQRKRAGWIVNPEPIKYQIKSDVDWFQPSDADLRHLSARFSNCSIAAACRVSETTVRKWLAVAGIEREREFKRNTGQISSDKVQTLRVRATRCSHRLAQRSTARLTKERVGRVISRIGEEAGIVIQQADERTGRRQKFASAHDLRHGCAQRLINAGVSAETLKVVMRHANFAKTENHYGALRSAQSAAREVLNKLADAQNLAFVGGMKQLPGSTPRSFEG